MASRLSRGCVFPLSRRQSWDLNAKVTLLAKLCGRDTGEEGINRYRRSTNGVDERGGL